MSWRAFWDTLHDSAIAPTRDAVKALEWELVHHVPGQWIAVRGDGRGPDFGLNRVLGTTPPELIRKIKATEKEIREHRRTQQFEGEW